MYPYLSLLEPYHPYEIPINPPLPAVGQPNYAGGYHSVRYYKLGKGTASQEATLGAEFDTTRRQTLESDSNPHRYRQQLIDLDHQPL